MGFQRFGLETVSSQRHQKYRNSRQFSHQIPPTKELKTTDTIMTEPTPPPVQLVPGQPPTQEQIQQIQAHFRKEAKQMGISYEAYIDKVKEQAAAQQKAHNDAQQQQQQQQQEPIQPGPPKPEALAVANWLRKQELKPRTCIFQEKRKEMFRGKIGRLQLKASSLTRSSQTSHSRPRVASLRESTNKEPSSTSRHKPSRGGKLL